MFFNVKRISVVKDVYYSFITQIKGFESETKQIVLELNKIYLNLKIL